MPYSTFTMDAAFFKIPKALMRGKGRRSVGPPISKFWSDLKRTTGSNITLDAALKYTSESEHPNIYRLEHAVPRMCPVQPYNSTGVHLRKERHEIQEHTILEIRLRHANAFACGDYKYIT
jgi:hypothetical protein